MMIEMVPKKAVMSIPARGDELAGDIIFRSSAGGFFGAWEWEIKRKETGGYGCRIG